MEWSHIPKLASLAVIDSLNVLAFAVIAGLWLTMRDRPAAFAPRAAQFTGGAFVGIMTLAALSVWVIGSNQERFRMAWNSPICAIILGLLGAVLLALGARKNPAKDEAAVSPGNPLPAQALRSLGLAGAGFALGIIQSGTSAPFGVAVIVISFAETAVLQRLVEIFVFAMVAIAPSVLLITVLSRVRSGEAVGRATVAINRFMRRAKALGRALTLAIGLALVVLAVVRLAQLGVFS